MYYLPKLVAAAGHRRLTGLVCGLLAAPHLLAANPVTEVRLDTLDTGRLAVSFGGRIGNSPYVDIDDITSSYSDLSYDLVPSYLYKGDRFFSTGTTIGAHLYQSGGFTLDAQVSYRFDRLEVEAAPYLEGVNERRQSLDGGFAGTYGGDWGEIKLTWLSDTLDRHGGEDLDLTYRFNWQRDKWFLSPFVSLITQDADLTDYYYGVSEAESHPDLPAYEAEEASFVRVGLNSTYRLHRNLLLYGNASWQTMDDTMTDSPLVDTDSLWRVQLGAAYLFGNVKDSLEKRDEAGIRDWSWRVNYGYTTQQTFHKVHRGQVEQSRDVETYLAGLTFGKILVHGDRTDFWGRASINRRLEEEYADDFWEFNLYGMLMGTGYSPWSDRELFRYGFGFGVSYSENISAQEATKQADRGEKTSRFLNYLEAQVDTPLSNIFGKNAWSNCYLGATIVHRSGIFGSADVFNNVSGGSDVLSAHLECKH